MRCAIHIALLAALLGGCAHTHPFNPAMPEGRAEFNAQSGRRSTIVVLTSGERAEAQALRLDAVEASWINPETGEARSVPLAEVRTVRVPARGRGALEGFAIGVGIGAGLGLLAVVVGEGRGPSLGAPSMGVAVGGGTLAFGMIGALVGVVSGRTLYVPEPPLVGSAALIPASTQADSLRWTPLHRLSVPQSASWNWEPPARGE